MANKFDEIAKEYDSLFTHTQIGIKQRLLVYNHLQNKLANKSNLNILELNGGTGEDSIWLAKKGHQVLCTDISQEMTKEANKKYNKPNLKFSNLDINHLANYSFEESFDLIFSNFGGLNCLSPKEIEIFLNSAKDKLNENGRLIMVIMAKNCLWENIFYSLKREWKKAGRKKEKFAMVKVGKENIKTYYFNPKDILKTSNKSYKLQDIKPIGFFVPPSYLEPIFSKRKILLNLFYKLDLLLKSFSFLGKYSDHFLIDLERK